MRNDAVFLKILNLSYSASWLIKVNLTKKMI